jgi:hypothetical protein
MRSLPVLCVLFILIRTAVYAVVQHFKNEDDIQFLSLMGT